MSRKSRTSRRSTPCLAPVLPIVFVLAAMLFWGAGVASAARQEVSITSVGFSDGQTISGTVRWEAGVTGSPDHVDFAVDGVVRWTEQVAPYTYNGNAGFDTTGLKNGPHALTVTAYPTPGNGNRVSASVTIVISNTVASTVAVPVSVTPPSVSGTASVGQVLTASNGSWSGTAPIAFAYQWKSCTSSGDSCVPFSNATGSSFVVPSSSAGSTIRVTVTASNSAGSASASSAATSPVTAGSTVTTSPTPTAAPQISGTPSTGTTLSSSAGSWAGSTPMSYGYQWETCDQTGSGCVAVSGATSSSFALPSGVAGSTVRVKVTASNSAGTASAQSAATAVVASSSSGGGSGGSGTTISSATVPTATGAPAVTGLASVGSTLSVSNGTWSGTAPMTFSFSWQQCDTSGGSCTAIAGANAASYVVASSDAGRTLRAVVTATNVGGSTAAASAQTAVIVNSTLAAASSVSLGANLPARLPQSSGHGGTFYVDGTSGSDSNSGSSSSPWRTINKALASVPTSGSVIMVEPGTYYSSGSNYAIKAYGFAGNVSDPVTLEAATPGTVTIANSDPTTSTIGAWIYGSTGLRIQGFVFTLKTGILNAGSPDEVLVENSDRVELYHNTFNETARIGIDVRGGSSDGQSADDVWILANMFRPSGSNIYAQSTGLGFSSDQYFGSKGSHWIYAGQVGNNSSYDYLSGSERLVVADNIFTGSAAGRDLELGPEARNSYVVDNTFFGNHSADVLGWSTAAQYAGEGVVFYSDTDTSTPYSTRNNIVTNNIFDDLDGHAAYGSGPAMTGNLVQRNLSWNLKNGEGHNGDASTDYLTYYNGVTSDVIYSTGAGNLPDADPRFTNPTGFDFHLQSGSPAAGTGDPAYAYPFDYFGNARRGADLGAVAAG